MSQSDVGWVILLRVCQVLQVPDVLMVIHTHKYWILPLIAVAVCRCYPMAIGVGAPAAPPHYPGIYLMPQESCEPETLAIFPSTQSLQPAFVLQKRHNSPSHRRFICTRQLAQVCSTQMSTSLLFFAGGGSKHVENLFYSVGMLRKQ
jgi:hypothetical protein